MASTEERVGKFLRRLLQNKSALELAQSVVGEPKPLPPRIPGGSSVSPISLDKRWQLLNLPEARRELLDPYTVDQADKYQNNIENLIGTVKVPVGLAGPLRMRGMFASGDYYVPLA